MATEGSGSGLFLLGIKSLGLVLLPKAVNTAAVLIASKSRTWTKIGDSSRQAVDQRITSWGDTLSNGWPVTSAIRCFSPRSGRSWSFLRISPLLVRSLQTR